jgi:hypothetical protein
MLYTPVRVFGGMVSAFSEPAFRLGVQASDVIEVFYRALKSSQNLTLNDLQTFGGNTYADLRLTINTFRGGGRVDITPGALTVDVTGVPGETNHLEVAKEHLQLCENTLRRALPALEISSRLLHAHLWMACEGGTTAMEAFLEKKGNAALKFDQGPYAALKKEFKIQFNGLDTSRVQRWGWIWSVPCAKVTAFFDLATRNMEVRP